MTCAKAGELLAAFADGGLEGREHDEVAAHVRSCAACADEVRVLRDLLADARRLAAPPVRDEAFWNDLARDIRVAVAAETPRVPWWRLPAIGVAFAMAAAAVLWVYLKGAPTTVPPRGVTPTLARAPRAARPLPPTFDVEDLDPAQLDAVAAALDAGDEAPTDDELAVASPAAPENLVESLDEFDLARLEAAL